MNSDALQFSGGRPLDSSIFSRLKKEGGLGIHKDKNGFPIKYVEILPDGRLGVYHYKKQKNPPMSQAQKEHKEFLEDMMEYEKSGHHRRVKPSEAKDAGERLEDFVEADRPLQGVDV